MLWLMGTCMVIGMQRFMENLVVIGNSEEVYGKLCCLAKLKHIYENWSETTMLIFFK